jgi:predicted transcriptional regulator
VKLLRAYLRKNHGMNVADYIDRWRLPANYPTAPAKYLEGKRAQAKASGLGVSLRGARGPAKAPTSTKPRRIVRVEAK